MRSDDHLIRCLVYIDLNMVRTGVVVKHPSEWEYGGYKEIQNPKQRYTLIDRQKLSDLLGMKNDIQLSEHHRQWVEEILTNGSNKRDGKWSESIAVGDKEFVLGVKSKPGGRAIGRRVSGDNGCYELRESQTPYTALFNPEKLPLRSENSFLWDVSY